MCLQQLGGAANQGARTAFLGGALCAATKESCKLQVTSSKQKILSEKPQVSSCKLQGMVRYSFWVGRSAPRLFRILSPRGAGLPQDFHRVGLPQRHQGTSSKLQVTSYKLQVTSRKRWCGYSSWEGRSAPHFFSTSCRPAEPASHKSGLPQRGLPQGLRSYRTSCLGAVSSAWPTSALSRAISALRASYSAILRLRKRAVIRALASMPLGVST